MEWRVMASKYLDKSKFVLAMECPAKLYYQARPNEYQSNKTENAFMQALAKAGYQVGELAKSYYRNDSPHDLSGMSVTDGLNVTNELLQQENVVIFEAAVSHGNLFLRADILIKNRDSLRLIEVKSSAWDKSKDTFFMKKSNSVKKEWLEYIYDVAFQKHVLKKAYPNLNISAYLGLLDKNAICPTQGLNQKFRITKDANGKIKITGTDKVNDEDLSQRLIIEENVDDAIRWLSEQVKFGDGKSLDEYIALIAEQYLNNQKTMPALSKVCADCEFRVSKQKLEAGKKCGFEECWRELAGFSDKDFELPSVLDLWFYTKKDELIQNRVYFLGQVDERNILPKKQSTANTPGLSRNERQLLQVEKAKKGDTSQYVDRDGLSAEIETWVYPLHFIDFETAAPAIPLDKGASPYEGFAFQFSHHVLYENGIVEHADQFLNAEIGVNPNISFIRALKDSLSKDEGTIFRYHNHENTYLNYILNELTMSGDAVSDKEDLIQFIQSIAKPTGTGTLRWEAGNRCMVDLCQLVERYTFDPLINGKTSIKKVLPAILSRSDFLQMKYSRAIYGKNSEIKSLNFEDPRAWVIKTGDQIADPYTLLPKLFENFDIKSEEIELLFDDEELREGGSASIAYMYMQFGEMSDIERSHLTDALLRYCELDTLAMVMIVESWLDLLA